MVLNNRLQCGEFLIILWGFINASISEGCLPFRYFPLPYFVFFTAFSKPFSTSAFGISSMFSFFEDCSCEILRHNILLNNPYLIKTRIPYIEP